MRLLTIALITTVVLGTVGCSSIDTYSDAALTQKTGILYYPPKPYLLVSRTGAKDKPVEVQVIYLPDLTQPRYAVMTSGIGSSNLSLTFSNGVLMSTNQQADPQIAAAITALAGAPAQLAASGKIREETRQLRTEASNIPEAVQDIRAVSVDIAGVLADPTAATALTTTQIASLRLQPPRLTDAALVLENPATTEQGVIAAVAELESVVAAIAAIKASAAPGETTLAFWAKVRLLDSRLSAAIAKLKPQPVPPATLSLYEVLMTGTGTQLREVPLAALGR